MEYRLKFRRDTAAAWAAANPVLAEGEAGVDLTNKEVRIGDGVSPWSELDAFQSRASLDAAYLASSLDPMRYDATRMRAWRAALGSRKASLFVLGDSVTEGRGASTAEARYVSRLRDGLRARLGLPQGGEGYVPGFYAASDRADRYTGTGVTQRGDLYGIGVRSISLPTSGANASITFYGTGCDLIHAETASAGSFSWAVDGGAATTVVTGGKENKGGKVIQIRGLERGEHTITLTRVTGNGGYHEGILVYDGDEDAGLHVWEGGHSSFRTTDYMNNAFWSDTLEAIDPDLLLIYLGLNDYGNGTVANRITPAAYKENLHALIERMRQKCSLPPSVVLVIPQERGGVSGAVKGTWAEYRQALLEVAQEDGAVTVLDLDPVIGAFTDDPYGLIAENDGAHPNDRGMQMIADALVNLLTTS